jgi:riboflavin biosynthesis pyrimidine reductase
VMASRTDVRGLQVLIDERPSPGAGELPDELRALYGGDLGFEPPVVYANMVTTIDGVAAERTRPRSSRDISRGAPMDRFVMALLRAHADAVVIGAGTLRAHAAGAWTAEHAYPAATEAFAAVRATLDLSPTPRLVVVSGTGDLPPHQALRGSIVMTSERGAGRLPDDVVEHAEVRVLPGDERGPDVARAIEGLRAEGHARILTEGGPRLLGSMVDAGTIDDLFLTVSPVVAGRAGGDARPGVVDGIAFAPDRFRTATLRSVRRIDSLLFLRYHLSGSPEGA